MKNPPTLLIADAIFPIDAPPIFEGAAIVIENDRILAIGPYRDLRPRFPHAAELRLPHTALVPGLINAHCHLELSYLRGILPPPTHFTNWVADLIRHYPAPDHLESTLTTALHEGLTESLRAGVTTIGDITRHPALTRKIMSGCHAPNDTENVCHALRGRGPVKHAHEPPSPTALALTPRILSYGEITALGTLRHRLQPLLNAAATPFPLPASSFPVHRSSFIVPHSVGLSPHAPYTIEAPALRAIVDRALADRLPIAMHLAELPEEAAFLRDLSGPLGPDFDRLLHLTRLDDKIPTHPGGPIRWALDNGLQDAAAAGLPILLAHVNYADDAELALLAAHRISIAYCPRTHHYFAHTPHRYRAMLAQGINVALGTDSLASNPDLHLLKEAQLLFQRDHTAPNTLLQMLTLNGARALGLQSQIGSLTPNKQADLIALPYDPNTPHHQIAATLLDTAPAPLHIWIGGQQI